MFNKRFLRKFFIASLAAGSLIFTPEIYGLPTNTAIVHAEIKEYVGVGESIVSDRETLEIGKEGAKLLAIRNAQKQAGVFIGSYSVMKNNELDTDEVVALTAEIVKVSDNVKYEPIQVEQWIKYRATVVVTIDTDDLTAKVNQWVGRSSQDRSTLTEQTKALNGTLDMIQTRTAELETAVLGASMTIDNATVKEELKQIDRDILYAQKISEGSECLRNGDRDGAMRLYQEAIALYPKDATIAYEKLGDSYLEAKDYARAIDAYTKVIQMDPNYSVSYYKRGVVYAHMRDYRKAAENFKKTVEHSSTSEKAYRACVGAYVLAGDYDAAIESLETLRSKKFNSFVSKDDVTDIKNCSDLIKDGNATDGTYVKRARLYDSLDYEPLRLFFRELEIADYNKALELNPNSDRVYYLRGCVNLWEKNYDAAINDFKKYVEFVAPNSAKDFYDRAEKFKGLVPPHPINAPPVENNDIANLAILCYTKAIELSPKNAIYLHGRGCFYYEKLGQHKPAIQDFEKALQLYNEPYDLYELYRDIVHCYNLLGDKKNAIKFLSTASKDKNLSESSRDKFKKELEQLKKSK